MNLFIPNFTCPITKSRTDSRDGGVAFYITQKAIETLTIKISHKSKSHILVCLYRPKPRHRPPKQNLTNLFYERVEQNLKMRNNNFPNSTLEILGDYNLNTLYFCTRDKFYEL